MHAKYFYYDFLYPYITFFGMWKHGNKHTICKQYNIQKIYKNMALYNKDLYQKGRKFVYHTTPTREEKETIGM